MFRSLHSGLAGLAFVLVFGLSTSSSLAQFPKDPTTTNWLRWGGPDRSGLYAGVEVGGALSRATTDTIGGTGTGSTAYFGGVLGYRHHVNNAFTAFQLDVGTLPSSNARLAAPFDDARIDRLCVATFDWMLGGRMPNFHRDLFGPSGPGVDLDHYFFFLLGYGGSDVRISSPQISDTKTVPVWKVGVGHDYYLRPRLFVRFEADMYNFNSTNFAPLGNGNGNGNNPSVINRVYVGKVGLNYTFSTDPLF